MTNIGNTTVTDACNWVNYTDSTGRDFLLRAWQVEVLRLIKKREPLEDFILKLAKVVYENNKSFIIEMDNPEPAIAEIKNILQSAGHDIVVSNNEGLIDVDVVACRTITPVWDWENAVLRFIGVKKPIDEFLTETVRLFFNDEKKRFISIDPNNAVRSVKILNNAIASTGYRVVLTTNNSSGYAKLRAV